MKYAGGCHCGKVRFEVDADIGKAIECNCSICHRAGWALNFVPAEKFTLLSGSDVLVDYHFGKKRINHVFCRECGIHSFCKGNSHDGKSEIRAINLRCLDGLELSTVNISKFDGKRL